MVVVQLSVVAMSTLLIHFGVMNKLHSSKLGDKNAWGFAIDEDLDRIGR